MPQLPPKDSTSSEPNDAQLWELIKSDDQKAWRTLVSRYNALVYSVAIRCGLSMTEAGDCFQTTWISLFKTRNKLQDPERLPAWLATTARREALRLRSARGGDPGDQAERELHDPSLLPDAELIQMERQSLLRAALARVDERCRRLLAAIFFEPEDLSYEEIAKRVGIAENSIGPTRRRCLEKLKTLVEKYL